MALALGMPVGDADLGRSPPTAKRGGKGVFERSTRVWPETSSKAPAESLEWASTCRADMCADMCTDMRTDMHSGVHLGMRAGMRVDARVQA